jgi:anaerobic magnesium-protoporphyrin IX monomethyl ester cyclase
MIDFSHEVDRGTVLPAVLERARNPMKKTRVFLVNVGVRAFRTFWAAPPLGILTLAAYLREKLPVELLLVDQRAENISAEEVAKRAMDFGAEIVGLSVMTPDAYLLNPIIRNVRAGLPGVPVIIGGNHPAALGAQVLESIEADAAVLGEGELALEQILRAYFDGGNLSDVAGLAWRNTEGAIVVNPGQIGFIEDLDSLPMPAYDLIDVSRYWRIHTVSPVARRRYVSLLSSRGCPYRCIFCHNSFGRRYRMHSAERVVAEIEHFQKLFGVDDIEFLDDTFNFNAQRIFDMCDLLRTRGIRVKLSVPTGMRSDILTEDVVEALAGAGMWHCLMALESGSPRIQKLIGKSLDIDRYLAACAMASKRRILVHSSCMLGFPTETREDLQQTIDIACEAQSHTAGFYLVVPFPGTRLYQMVREQNPQKLEGLCFDGATLTTASVNLTDLPDHVLLAYQRKAVRKYTLNPARIARLIQVHPKPWSLPLYAPLLAFRLLRGMVS